jgi:hypothetical protein
MAEPVKPNSPVPHHQTAKMAGDAGLTLSGKRSLGLRTHVIALMLLVAAAAGQGCATQDQASQAGEHAAMESEDDTACREKGAPDSPAYDACRKDLAAARVQNAAVREQKRRDFDRVLGAGTEGQSNY